jgi:hypothetical protein
LRKKIDQIKFKRDIKKDVPVFVFQMGKVGSRSIVDSLMRCYSGVVVHRHFITGDDWKAGRMLELSESGKPLKIISPVRDPIGRNVSAFFHFIEGRTGQASDRTGCTVEELVDLFISNSDLDEVEENRAMMDHAMPIEWFDENIKKYFNIDIYDKEFPSSGYDVYKNKNIELLVLRIDVDDRVKEKIVREFLGFNDFVLSNTNVAKDKKYAKKYNEFKKNAVLPDEYLDEMCSSKYFRHFYSDDEIRKIRKKWMER